MDVLNELISNIGLLALLAVVFSLLRFSQFAEENSVKSRILIGFAFGCAAAVLMLNPVTSPFGATFDARGGPALLAGIYAGPIGAIVASGIGAIVRYEIGGASALGGACGFLLYGVASYAAQRIRSALGLAIDWRVLLALALFGTLCVLPAFFIGQSMEMGLNILSKAWWVLLIGNIAGVLILGLVVELDFRRHGATKEIKNKNQFIDSIVNAQPSHFAVLDSNFRIQHVNQAWIDFHRQNGGEVVDWSNVYYFENWDVSANPSLAALKHNIEKVAKGELNEFDYLYPCHHSTEERWYVLMVRPIEWGSEKGVCAFHINSTQEKLLEHQARVLMQATEQSAVMTFITDDQGVIRYINPKFSALTGYSDKEVIGKNASLLTSDETPQAMLEALWKSARNGKEWRGEVKDRCKNGDEFWASVVISPVRDLDGNVTQLISMHEDITEHKELEEVTYLAMHDALTGLDNRRSFIAGVENKLATIGHTKNTAAIVILDVDHFKSVNDRHGHPVGDQVLQELSRRLLAAARSDDLVARIGGEEFAILISLREANGAKSAVERFQKIISDKPFQLSGVELNITASFGVCDLNPNSNLDEVLGHCDEALYDAKNAGRNRVRIYNP